MIIHSNTMLLLILAASTGFIAFTQAHSTVNVNGTIISRAKTDETLVMDSPVAAEQNYRNLRGKDYEADRASVIEQEELKATGGHLQLTAKELQVHKMFMTQKTDEMQRGMKNPTQHAPGMHFFKARDLIRSSKVFKFLQQMPKGASLHTHNSAAVSSEWIIRNITRTSGLLSCYNMDGLVLTFRQDSKRHQCKTAYVKVADERAKALSVRQYDEYLEQKITLFTRQPEVTYDKVWIRFEEIFNTIGDALKYLPAYRAFHWRMLEEMWQDKIMYAEIRMRFRPLYGEKGETIGEHQSIKELINVLNEFKREHPDFFGIKIIFATSGDRTKASIRAEFEVFKKWHALYPDFIIGFDLVGQEKNKIPLHSAAEVLQDLPVTAKFFFHAGETNWLGKTVDINMLDAILMNTHRIGHGYALLKHPVMRKAVQEREIALEICPISNQVLNMVWDLRNHPGAFFLSEDVPMVIANDDPGFWAAKGLSYDMYYAIMSFAPINAGLKTLKNIAWNSIKYSALNQEQKKAALAMLDRQWNEFVQRAVDGKLKLN